MHIKLNNIVKKLDTPIEQLCLNTFKLRTTKTYAAAGSTMYMIYNLGLQIQKMNTSLTLPKDKLL